MASPYKGEKTIKLNGIKYPMKINLDVITSFTQETGKDFMHIAINSINAFAKCQSLGYQGLEQAAELTSVVSMVDAAHIFYLAAKECNSQVEFGEIQEAILAEGALPRDGFDSYPVAFIDLMTFAVIGPSDEATKKSSTE